MKSDDIVSVLNRIGIARSCLKVGSEWVSSPCPFARFTHPSGRDSHASFGVSIDPDGSSGFNCFSCGTKGSLASLPFQLSELDGVDRQELEDFIQDQEIPVALPPWEQAGEKKSIIPPHMDEEAFDELFDPAYRKRSAVAYFTGRGISREFMKRFDLRWDAYRKRVLFKVKRKGRLYGASGRTIRPNVRTRVRVYNHKTSLFLLGEEHISADLDKPLVVIEGLMGLGELDTLGLYEYADAVCLQGSSLSKTQRDRLVELNRHIVLLFDNDAAGHKGLYGSKKSIGAVKMLEGLCSFHVAQWPEGFNDFPDLTPRKLRRMVRKTVSFID